MLCRREYSKRPLLARMQAWIRNYVCATGHAIVLSVTLYSTPTHQPIRRYLKELTTCTFVVDSLRNYAPDVVNRIGVMAVGDHKSGVMNAWRLASFSSYSCRLFKHFRPRSRHKDNHCRTGKDPSLSISGVWPAFLGDVSFTTAASYFFPSGNPPLCLLITFVL